MEFYYCRRLIAVYLPLMAVLFSIVEQSYCRELRPSEHGLNSQLESSASTIGDEPPDMSSFFAGGTETGVTSNVPLPEAKNTSDPLWWSSGGNGGGGGRLGKGKIDEVWKVVLVGSVVCGIAGVVLLVVTAVVFLCRLKKVTSSTTPQPPLALPPPPAPPPLLLK